ncbi:MAG: 4Fe-4S dicluster domain-containing protein [Methanimicrococcus sp.]|nr:4Fe-4S dicluster domain-containing protein [Methanimicrococcus sp.]
MKTFYSFLLEKQNAGDIQDFGFAPVSSWDAEKNYLIPSEFFPKNIFPEAETAIVIAVPVLLPILETTPSIFYNEHYHAVNAQLDAQALKISLFLNNAGFPTVPIPRDGYAGIPALQKNPTAAFSHKHAAYHAGLGTFGQNNVLLTKDFGPRIRFTTILTKATLKDLENMGIPSNILDRAAQMKKENLCIQCMDCARYCPKNAIIADKNRPYPLSIIDKQKCVSQSAALAEKGISPCGICIKVCPIGKDRVHFDRENITYEKDAADENEQNKKRVQAWEHVQKCGFK